MATAETILTWLELIGVIAITYAVLSVLYEAARFLKAAADCLQGVKPFVISHNYNVKQAASEAGQ